MDPIEFLILITVAITIFELGVVCHSILDFFFLTPIFGPEGIFVPTEWSGFIIGTLNQIAATIIPFYILILLFYVIMYILYLIIINIIPETGPKSFFIPIREILLKIPPFPALIKYGVFKLMDDLVYSLGFTNIVKMMMNIIASVFNFSRDNIKRILIFLLPDYEQNINEYDYKMQKEEAEKEVKEEVKNELHEQIDEEKNICQSNNTNITTPDISLTEMVNDNMTDIYNTVDCEQKAMGNYIRSNK
jgi:hypothetical protein